MTVCACSSPGAPVLPGAEAVEAPDLYVSASARDLGSALRNGTEKGLASGNFRSISRD